METCLGRLKTQQICVKDQVLHGVHSISSGLNPAGRLDDLSRHERCIFSCSDSPSVETIPQVCFQQESLPVQSTLLRTQYRTPSVYQSTGSVSQDRPPGRVQDNSLLGRLACRREISPAGVESQRLYTEFDGTTGYSDQLGEVGPRTLTSDNLPRDGNRLEEFLGFSHSESNRQRTVNNYRVYVLRNKASQIMAVSAGTYVLSGKVRARSETEDETSTVPPQQILGQDLAFNHDPHPNFSDKRPDLVEQQVETKQRHFIAPKEPPPSVIFRRFSRRLGSGSRGHASFRAVVLNTEERTHKYPGAQGNLAGSPGIITYSKRQDSSCLFRQPDSTSLHLETRGNKILESLQSSQGSDSLVRTKQHRTYASVHSRRKERSSGRPQQERASPSHRVDSSPTSLRPTVAAMGPTTSGSVRHESKQEAAKLHVSPCGSSSYSSGRFFTRLVQRGPLCLPSFRSHQKGLKQVSGQSKLQNDSCGALVASKRVVPGPSKPGSGGTKASSTQTRPAASASGESSSLKPPHASLDRLETLNCLLRFRKFSSKVSKSIYGARGPTTNALYQQRWATFVSWCRSRKISASRVTISQVCEFLIYLFEEKNMAPATIQGYRSSLHSVLRHTGLRINNDEDVADVVRSLRIRAPKNLKKTVNWNLDVVLKFLCSEKFEPLRDVSLLNLTKKTIILVALALAKRISELQALSRQVGFSSEGALLSLVCNFRAKNDFKCKRLPRNFFIKELSSLVGNEEEALLCPVRALKEYIRRTKSLVSRDLPNLFVSPRKPSRPASKNALTFLIKLVIKEAHESLCPEFLPLLKVKTHELRAVSTSVAFKHNLSLDSVMEAAQWRCKSVFASHYLKEVAFEFENCRTLGPLIVAGSVIT